MRDKLIKNVWVLAALFAVGCTSNPLEVPVDIETNRPVFLPFHIDFFDTTQSIEDLRAEYAPFLTSEVPDAVWDERRTNSFFTALNADVQQVFPSMEPMENEIAEVLAHYRHYYPERYLPEIYTYVSGADVSYPIIDADSMAFIALDIFLGADHPAYAEVPQYIRRRFTPDYLPVKFAAELADRHIQWNPTDLTLLNSMIYWGKIAYFIEAMAPDLAPEILHEYTPEEERWAEEFETEIWGYLLAQDLLFDQRTDTRNRFVEEAPFSKFYAGIDRESPGRIGRWLGWRIVHSYMKNYSVSLPELMRDTDHRTLFNKSNYKPHG